MGSPPTGAGWMNNDRHDSIHHKISIPPKILRPSASNPSCCIFRVHHGLVEANGHDAYHPRIISIGPYHLGQPHLSMMQEHKYRYLDAVLSRSPLSFESLVHCLEPLFERAVECYSETISLSRNEFLEMLVLDSVFLIELFLRSQEPVLQNDDPIFTMTWVQPLMSGEFLYLENQIPFFILKKIYSEVMSVANTSVAKKSDLSLAELALEFFNIWLDLPSKATASCNDLSCRHLLDLVRATFLPRDKDMAKPLPKVPTHVIHSVSKLRRSGIHLRASKRKETKTDTFLAVRFNVKRGLLEMPMIAIYDQTGAILANCIAYEQCHHGTTDHFTTYVTLLDCLVNTAKDVEYMCEHEIIENHLGTDEEVAKLINNMKKDVAFDYDRCYLTVLFNDVHNYYKNTWHVRLAGLKYTYLGTPWYFISALAAFFLLLFTLAQTFFTIFAYFLPRSSSD